MGTTVRIGSKVAHAAEWRARAARAWAARTVEIVRVTHREHPGDPLGTARRAADLVARRGFTLDEAFTLGLLEPSRTAAELDDHVSKRRMIGLQASLNPNEFWYLTEDKAIFYRLAESLGLPVPRLHAILCQSGPGWTRTGDVLGAPGDWARFLESGAPDEFVVKPARGYHGHGVRLVRRRGSMLDVAGSGPTTAADLCRELVADRRFHIHVVQERLRDHPDLPGDGSALQTLRIVTLVARDGRVRVLNAQFRLAAPGNAIDNFADGTTGNLLAIIGLEDGSLGPIIRPGARRVLERVPAGTLDGAPPAGARLPYWDEIGAVVSEAAPHFLPMRAIGWDVAITPDGPRIVEANIWWDPPTPQPGMGALVEELRTA